MAGEEVPDRDWTANAIGISAAVVDAAIERLEGDGWIAPRLDGRYIVCQVALSPSRASSMLEAMWGDTYPVPTGPVEPMLPRTIAGLLQTPPPPPSLEVLLGKPVITYLIGIEGLPFTKIGRTKGDAKARLSGLQTGQPLKLFLLGTWDGDYESELHAHFGVQRVRGEWFDLTSLGDPVEVVNAAIGEIEAASEQLPE